jgi:hypothetical protein
MVIQFFGIIADFGQKLFVPEQFLVKSFEKNL